jgi:hypothetical protein
MMVTPKVKERRYMAALLRGIGRHRLAWREAELAAREVDGVIELPLAMALCVVKRWKAEDSNG